MSNLGIRLKQLREEKGLTQKELAAILGLKHQTSISNYENNNQKPPSDILGKLSEIFNVSVDYLLGFTDDKENKNLTYQLYEFVKMLDDSTISEIEGAIDYFEQTKKFSKNDMAFIKDMFSTYIKHRLKLND
jgi:transcriptional regulator with XRE-family HTH domain